MRYIVRCAIAFLLALSATGTAWMVETLPPAPSALLLSLADLPSGYVSDDALENADATARSTAYSTFIVASAFVGFRTQHAAVADYVARLHDAEQVAQLLAQESSAVDRTRGAARITLSGPYGDTAVIAYQQSGGHGEQWVMVLFGQGSYITTLGAYNGAGEQAAIDLLQHLAPVAASRLRAAARQALPTAAPSRRSAPVLRFIALMTMTRGGRLTDLFRPHSVVYWRAVWRVGALPRRARETLRDWLRHGAALLYSNAVTDRPYSGDNGIVDHLQLKGAAPGAYSITVAVTIGRYQSRATQPFRVALAAK